MLRVLPGEDSISGIAWAELARPGECLASLQYDLQYWIRGDLKYDIAWTECFLHSPTVFIKRCLPQRPLFAIGSSER